MRKNKAAIEFYCQGKNYRLSVIKVLRIAVSCLQGRGQNGYPY